MILGTSSTNSMPKISSAFLCSTLKPICTPVYNAKWMHSSATYQCRSYVAPVICDLIDQCFVSAYILIFWSKPALLPSKKTGNFTDAKNFRPISILPLYHKIFKKCIYLRLQNCLTSCNLIAMEVFGFQIGCWTEKASLK